MMLYKYRGIQGFKFFVDIILKKRLYAASYFDLNDPMEGRYLYNRRGGIIDKNMLNLLKGEKEMIKICSLSRNSNNELMWSHYAEGNKGVVIGVEVDQSKYIIRPIEYNGLHQVGANNFNAESAIDILSHKLDVWKYEEEERVFARDGMKYVNVDVKQVICGSRMSNQDKSLITDLIKKIDPNIEIINARTNSVHV